MRSDWSGRVFSLCRGPVRAAVVTPSPESGYKSARLRYLLIVAGAAASYSSEEHVWCMHYHPQLRHINWIRHSGHSNSKTGSVAVRDLTMGRWDKCRLMACFHSILLRIFHYGAHDTLQWKISRSQFSKLMSHNTMSTAKRQTAFYM